MSDTTNHRKWEHVELFRKDEDIDRKKRYFDQIHLRHRALPELNLQDVDTTTSFLNKPLQFPLLISSMTGGDHDVLLKINQNLAQAANHCGVAMAVGSQRVMFTDPAAQHSFSLRGLAPHIPLIANLGAVQLNKGFSIHHAQQAVDVMQADGLYLHLNPLQEAVQPEGDTHFHGLAEKIGNLQDLLSVPVLLKEVGAGMSSPDAALAIQQGIRYLDVAGSGGTSWSRIEHHRRKKNDLGLLFQDWGIPTPLALQELAPYREHVTLIASGGIRNGIDMVKAMVLGASLCGMAAPFLEPARHSVEAVIEKIESVQKEFTTAMFLLGVGHIKDLIGQHDFIL